MQPYYDDGQVTIYLGDARELMPQLQADLILTDPPYNQTSLEWDKWVDGWPALALASLTPRGSLWCFGSMRMFMDRRDDFAAWQLAQDLVWEKHNGSSFHNQYFKRVHESICHFYPKASRWADVYRSPVFTMDATKRTIRRKERPPHMGDIEEGAYVAEDGGPRLMRSVQFVRSTHGYAIHPTQKPIGILTPLLRYGCPPDGVVLDPFGGSCATLVAAKELGLRAIAIEINEGYLEAAVESIRRPIETAPLPAPPPTQTDLLAGIWYTPAQAM